jgi:5-formaminoimidazole-4-carboxamide-1-(beta)-D-ribofuranosyl 5'-monophosphate synthetase
MFDYIATLGGHSALEIFLGAKKQNFKTIAIVQNGRDKTYSKYYSNLVDELILLDNFSDVTKKEIIDRLIQKNAVFIPHRYVQVYCDLKKFEKEFTAPVFGNKYLLKYEERTGVFNQYQILFNAGVDFPRQYEKPQDIDRLVIVKVAEAQRSYERSFFFAKTAKEYQEKAEKLLTSGKILKKDLDRAVIEEYVIGALINFNFYYSPLRNRLELLGTDIRRQTNIDGLNRIPLIAQKEIMDEIYPSYIEVGHIAVTVKESILEKAFLLAQKIVDSVKTQVAPGIIGPFALQSAVTAGPPKENIVVYDLSLRMPGSPGISFTPYSQYLYGTSVSFGVRIAMEIKEAQNLNKINLITT